MSGLTREEILGFQDGDVKRINVPFGPWKGKEVWIRTLNRGEQDEYLRRQYGPLKMRQERRAKEQEIGGLNLYGHDAFLCVKGLCNNKGERLFSDADEPKLLGKNGETIGFIAKEILSFSGMDKDVEVLDKVKNSSTTPSESSSTD